MESAMAIKTCKSILEQMKKDGYSELSIQFYNSVYKALHKYLFNNNCDQYTEEVLDSFLIDVYGIRINDFRYLSKHKKKCIRAMELICIYSTTKKIPVLVSYAQKTKKEIPDMFQKAHDEYAVWLENEGLAPATRNQRKMRSRLFLEFLASQSIENIDAVSAEHLYSFTRSLDGFANHTINLYILILNDFLRYLYLNKFIRQDLSRLISTVMKRDERLPSIWKQEEIGAYLGAIDRATPIGKRDYAVSILAIRLGLRGSDIRELQLKDFDWNNNSINLCQRKTKEPLSLPLMEDIGWAVIDYICGLPINYRPKT